MLIVCLETSQYNSDWDLRYWAKTALKVCALVGVKYLALKLETERFVPGYGPYGERIGDWSRGGWKSTQFEELQEVLFYKNLGRNARDFEAADFIPLDVVDADACFQTLSTPEASSIFDDARDFLLGNECGVRIRPTLNDDEHREVQWPNIKFALVR